MAALAALDSGKLHAFVTDFPTPELIAHPKVVALPHLGASTGEAEANCAIMVAENIKDYLENGNIRFAVNFPDAQLPRVDAHRIAIANANVPNMVGQISTILANSGLNIADLLNKSRGDVAYTIMTAAATSADPNYNGYNADDVSATNTDDDTAGITVTPTAGLVTTEAGGSAQLTVVLDSEPTAGVTITVASDNTSEGTVSVNMPETGSIVP